MQVEWYGQSAFRLSTPETTVAIDPFDDVSGLTSRGAGPVFDTRQLPVEQAPLAVVPAAP